MKRVSMKEFGNLINASNRQNDEFDADVEQIGSEIVRAAIEAQRVKDTEMVQAEILEVLDRVRMERDERVRKIRDLRAKVTAETKFLDKMDEAKQVGLDTGDFRPLLTVLGVEVDGYTWKQ